MSDKTILVIGTFDTKNDELSFLANVIRTQDGKVLTMDVSVLGEPSEPTDYSKHAVAQEGGSSIAAAIESNDENLAMQIMAAGAALLTSRLYAEGKFDGVIVLGGTMGTTQMILWAGGLYGLNSVCKASLSQAAGAVLGAARAVVLPDVKRPLIGMTSLGKSALTYMVALKPALEERGYEVAVFHATGMGGRAFESLAAQGAFVCVFDFCTQELGNHLHGSNISAGPDRLTHAGLHGTPQIVAPGCYDLVDIVGWQPSPEKWSEHPKHEHNRLLSSIVLNEEERRQVARAHCEQLAKATAPVTLVLPLLGMCEWDREGAELHNKTALDCFINVISKNWRCPDLILPVDRAVFHSPYCPEFA